MSFRSILSNKKHIDTTAQFIEETVFAQVFAKGTV